MVKDQVVLWQQFSRLKTVKHETSKRLFDFLHAARLYIERHYLEPIALSSIAQEAHLSEYHFIRLFKKLFGRTPYQYVLHLRLQHAQLLMQQGYGVAEVAFQTGFADKSAFCKAFKKKFGQTTSALK
jgi:AraC-like DNA-binding protein